VIITDLRMPDVDGLTILAEAKRLHPDTEVIVVTAFSTTENRDCRHEGRVRTTT